MEPGVEGAAGNTLTDRELVPLVPQLLDADTVMFPFCPGPPVVTAIEVVPAPDVIVQPEGTLHIYVVAFGTAAML